MAQDVEARQQKPSNPCCAKLQRKYSKLLEKYVKNKEMNNELLECGKVLNSNFEASEKVNESLKKALEEVKLQISVCKDEKDKEAGRRIDLEDEVSALQDEVRLLKQNGSSASEGGDEQLQDRLARAEEEIKQLRELLDQERGKVASEKKRAELEKKTADGALKMLEKGKNEISEAREAADAERKKAEEYRLQLEKLKKEMKSKLALEKSKSGDAEKKMEIEKQKAIGESKRADLAVAKSVEQQKFAEANLKKANLEKNRADDLNRKLEQARKRAEELEGELLRHKSLGNSEDRLLLEKLKKETDVLKSMLDEEKSKSEAAHKKVDVEKQKAVGESKKADLAVAKFEKQKKLAETNLKKAKSEKDRADDLSRKLEEARNMAEKLELELRKHISSAKSVEVQADKTDTGRVRVPAADVCMGTLKSDTPLSKWVEKMLLEKEQNIVKEKRRADSAKKKAKKQTEVAEEHKKMSMEQKHRADQLSGQLEMCKLRVEVLQKELQEFASWRIFASTSPIMNSDVTLETDSVELLKKQLKLEKLLAKHAKEATNIEAFRNKMLQQELCYLKQESLQFQQRLNLLDKSFLHGSEGIDQLQKISDRTTQREILGSDWDHRRLISGIDSRMDPPYRGSNQKMLQSSAINSSSASFSDRPLVGSQERGTLSIMTSANLGDDISNFKEKISDKMQHKYNVSKADNRTRNPTKDGSSKRRDGSREKKRTLGAVESVENLNVRGETLCQQVSEKESLKVTSCRELSRPLKKRKTSSKGTIIIHRLQDSGESKGLPDSVVNNSDACLPPLSPGSDAIRSDCGFEDGTNYILGHNRCTPDFDRMVADDYMKLLDMDNAADEDAYRRAIAKPLSPTLPEVEFHRDQRVRVGSSEMLVHKSFQEGLSNVRSSPVVIQTEKNLTDVVSNGSVPSHLPMEHNSVDFSKDMALPAARGTHCQEIHVASRKLGMPHLSGSRNGGTIESCESGIASNNREILKYIVVSSDSKENSSILRILQTVCSCTPNCSFDHSVEILVQNIVGTLSKAKDLSTREKASVFLSLILPVISEVGLKNFKNGLGENSIQALGSVSKLSDSALSDPALKKMVMESCGLFELLALIEDLLQQQKVFVYVSASSESEFRVTSKLNFTLNGNPITLLEVAASAHLLIAGGSLLASLCSAVDHIGYVCEISCNIIRMQKLDSSVMLAILHAFALRCGSKYFTLQQYSIGMAVVKSLVMFLEKQTASATATSFSLSGIGNQSSTLLCKHCPFSAGAVSVDDAAVMLLENLQKQCGCGSWGQDSLALVNNLLVPDILNHEDVTEEVPGLGKFAPFSSARDEDLCNFLDVISLVEALASVMSWEWTSDHLVKKICEYSELHLTEGSSAAIIILLGQLGRIGVIAGGYDDSGVQKLRGWFSKLACETTFKKLSIPVQFSIITSLFGVTPIKFEEIAEGKIKTPAATSQSVRHSCIRNWFLSLKHEQQSFLRLHLAAS